MIRVIEPGMLTTVQDLGRPGWTAIGVSRGGAADPLSLRIGNRLVGNSDVAAALEMTLLGGRFEFMRSAAVALTGGQVEARLQREHHSLAVTMWTRFHVVPGDQLIIGPIRRGVRTYLCVAGGIRAPEVLGSRSTHLSAGFGGFEGRALRRGAVLDVDGVEKQEADSVPTEAVIQYVRAALARRVLRAVDGAHAASCGQEAVEAFWASSFEVAPQSDRVGVRLIGAVGGVTSDGRLPSEGMMNGAVQVPPSGEPIVLMVDHPTTGGYPVIACVIAADLPVLGQLRPRDRVRFEHVDLAQARACHAQQEILLAAEASR